MLRPSLRTLTAYLLPLSHSVRGPRCISGRSALTTPSQQFSPRTTASPAPALKSSTSTFFTSSSMNSASAAASSSASATASASSSSSSSSAALPDSLHISQLSVRLPLGVDNWERLSPQPVLIDVQVHTDVSLAGKSDHLPYSIHYGILVKEVEKHCEEAGKEAGKRYKTLEALANGIAKVCLFNCKAPKVSLKVRKPRSLLHAKSAGVEIHRMAEDFIHPDGRLATHGESVQNLHSLELSTRSKSAIDDQLVINDLLLTTILGVNPWERVDKQVVRVNLTVYSGLDRLQQQRPSSVDVVTSPQNYRTIVKAITEHIEATDYKTVESLALSVARVAIMHNRVPKIKVRVDKPSAIMFADAAGCEVVRDRSFFEGDRWRVKDGETQQKRASKAVQATPLALSSASGPSTGTSTTNGSLTTSRAEDGWHVAAIALGSNLGDRARNIDDAVTALSASPDCKVIDTSFLYETAPMYYTDQPKFLNGACRIATRLSPERLLDLTQNIETRLGRNKAGVPVKGPRLVDLDIIFYDRLEMSTPRLIVPHPGLREREFVLRPLADILPDYAHPTERRTVRQLLNILVNSVDYEAQDVHRVLPILAPSASSSSSSIETQYWSWGSKTFLMGIINATPDSFSDGGDNATVESAVQTAIKMVQQGVDVLDVGGMSTAPNAAEITSQEEIARVVPVIEAIRSAGVVIPISIDTFRADVAQAALRAGANLINDVSGGLRDPAILDVAREAAVPYILMHTRGDSSTMSRLSDYSSSGGVLQGVSSELSARVQAALQRGLKRWQIILDPGIGFAKDLEGNLELIRGLGHITGGGGSAGLQAGDSIVRDLASSASANHLSSSSEEHSPNPTLQSFPLLLGSSRKRFLGTLTGRGAPKDRVYGTAATCVAGIAAGVDLLRVHDVEEMKDVSRVADAIYRVRRSGKGKKAGGEE